MSKSRSVAAIEAHYPDAPIVRAVVLLFKNEYIWLLPNTDSKKDKDIVATQLRAQRADPSAPYSARFMALLARLSFSRLVSRNEEAECWLAAMCLDQINKIKTLDQTVL